MNQSRVESGRYSRDPSAWFEHHRDDYAAVHSRLRRARETLLRGGMDEAADNLRKSYVFAVLSIQTERERHERAFTRWCAGDLDVREAALETVYGGQKGDWIESTLADADWAALVRAIRTDVREGAIERLLTRCENLTGVAYRKWVFTLAMVGVWEVCCIDSNVGRHLGISDRAFESPAKADASEYASAMARVAECVDAEAPPFLAQWAVYDFERGEHARHMPFFREIRLAD